MPDRVRPLSTIAILVAAGLSVCGYAACKRVWQVAHLEQSARKAIAGTDLQAWAAGVLQQYPYETNFTASALGTNFPQCLRGLGSLPHVVICMTSGTNDSPHLRLHWQALSRCAGFLIGAKTNCVLSIDAPWQPGVYFYHD